MTPRPSDVEISDKRRAKVDRKRHLMRVYGRRCWYCNRYLSLALCTTDHLQPLNAGGRDVIENERPCCRRCNGMKGSMPLGEFLDQCRRIVAVHATERPTEQM